MEFSAILRNNEYSSKINLQTRLKLNILVLVAIDTYADFAAEFIHCSELVMFQRLNDSYPI